MPKILWKETFKAYGLTNEIIIGGDNELLCVAFRHKKIANYRKVVCILHEHKTKTNINMAPVFTF
jgi:hypothetical protein